MQFFRKIGSPFSSHFWHKNVHNNMCGPHLAVLLARCICFQQKIYIQLLHKMTVWRLDMKLDLPSNDSMFHIRFLKL